MAIFRVEKTRDYIVMAKYHLKDRSLSLKSKGLLTTMLSLPEQWNYTTRGLAAICKEGVESIGTALKELENAGYIVRNRLRDKKGRITDTEYVIYEQPQKPPDTPKPDADRPYPGNPYMDEPYTENRAQLNNNKSNNSNKLNINRSIAPAEKEMNRIDEIARYKELIKDNIEYDTLIDEYGAERMDEIVELILETVCTNRKTIRIAGEDLPSAVVKSRFLKLDCFHIEYCFDCLDKNTTKVYNIKNYLLTALYNAATTKNSYYRNEVNHDLHRK
jgi:hypothetical protein